jgi:hypothetical protein
VKGPICFAAQPPQRKEKQQSERRTTSDQKREIHSRIPSEERGTTAQPPPSPSPSASISISIAIDTTCNLDLIAIGGIVRLGIDLKYFNTMLMIVEISS